MTPSNCWTRDEVSRQTADWYVVSGFSRTGKVRLKADTTYSAPRYFFNSAYTAVIAALYLSFL
jgi:hypothetical protein